MFMFYSFQSLGNPIGTLLWFENPAEKEKKYTVLFLYPMHLSLTLYTTSQKSVASYRAWMLPPLNTGCSHDHYVKMLNQGWSMPFSPNVATTTATATLLVSFLGHNHISIRVKPILVKLSLQATSPSPPLSLSLINSISLLQQLCAWTYFSSCYAN